MSEYYAGMGCRCAAWSENECACPDVDWTPEEVYELRKQLKALQDAITNFGVGMNVYLDTSNNARCGSCHNLAGTECKDDCSYQELRKVLKAQEVSDE